MTLALVSGVDRYCWVAPDGTYTISDRGDVIDVTDEEFNRVPGALSTPEAAPVADEAPADAPKPAKTK